jgi:amino acid adenylation domain-containing protein
MQTGFWQPHLLQERSPRADSAASIAARIAHHAAATPHRLAVDDGVTRLTFADLDGQSNQLASHLLEAGAGPEICVALLLERSAQFIVAAFAVLKTGAAYLPLDPSTPADRVTFILTDATAPLLLSHRHKARDLPSGAWRVIDVDGPEAAKINARPAASLNIDPAPDSLAYVVYTSGSMGRPKGVEISHANLDNLIRWHQAAFNVTAADHASQVAGLGFDAVAWEIWPHLTAGAAVHIADEMTRRSPQSLRDWLIAEKITISFVPTVPAEQLIAAPWPPETSLRTLLTGADTLHRRPIAGLPFVFVNNYGPTECTVVSTSGVVAPDPDAKAPPSIGRPIANTTAFILDEWLNPVAPGEPGELCLAGALVGRGYRNHPELTASRFVDYKAPSGQTVRIYRTGDRARLLDDGQIAFLGRLDDQVKIRGYRIEPGEIAACLDHHSSVQASAVKVVIPSGNSDGREAQDPYLVAYVVAAPTAALDASDLRDFLARRLPDYMTPAHYVRVADFPLTPNGKLNRAALPAPTPETLLPFRASAPAAAVSHAATSSPAAAPAHAGADISHLQQKLAGMVASLLGQPSVEPHANFFTIGGHSMLGVQLVAKIRDAFGVKLTLRQLFSSPTIAGLAAEVARLNGGGVGGGKP